MTTRRLLTAAALYAASGALAALAVVFTIVPPVSTHHTRSDWDQWLDIVTSGYHQCWSPAQAAGHGYPGITLVRDDREPDVTTFMPLPQAVKGHGHISVLLMCDHPTPALRAQIRREHREQNRSTR